MLEAAVSPTVMAFNGYGEAVMYHQVPLRLSSSRLARFVGWRLRSRLDFTASAARWVWGGKDQLTFITQNKRRWLKSCRYYSVMMKPKWKKCAALFRILHVVLCKRSWNNDAAVKTPSGFDVTALWWFSEIWDSNVFTKTWNLTNQLRALLYM